MRNVEELSQMIIGALCERRGFDDWWYNTDEDAQEEILEDIRNTYSEWVDAGEMSEDEDDEGEEDGRVLL